MTLISKLKTVLKNREPRVDGPRMIDITHCDRVGFDDAMSGSHAFGRTLLLPGGGYIHPRPMLWPCEGSAIERPHTTRAKIPDIDLYFVRDAVVGGFGSHLSIDGAWVYAQGPYPDYIKFWFENQITPELWGVAAPVSSELETAFVIAHFNFVWGHWLTEIYPKLFLIEALAKEGVTAPILLPSSAPSYVSDIIKATLPEQQVIVYDHETESVLVRRALLPHMLHRHYVFHDFLHASLDRQALSAPLWGRPNRIFVSRRNLEDTQSYRRMTNQLEIEEIAEEVGLQSVSPETLGWREQIATFSNASVIVGEFGSGLHNALFSPARTQVMALNWIVDVQSRIANFKQHDIGYLLPADGVPRTHNLLGETQDYIIDPQEFRTKAEILMEGAEKIPLRHYEDIPILQPR